MQAIDEIDLDGIGAGFELLLQRPRGGGMTLPHVGRQDQDATRPIGARRHEVCLAAAEHECLRLLQTRAGLAGARFGAREAQAPPGEGLTLAGTAVTYMNATSPIPRIGAGVAPSAALRDER